MRCAKHINIYKCGVIDYSSLQFLFSEEQEVSVNQGDGDLVQSHASLGVPGL